MKHDDGGPAFPWHQSLGNQENLGMSLRDWFAGMAMQSLKVDRPYSPEAIAIEAYRLADAMIAARKEKP